MGEKDAVACAPDHLSRDIYAARPRLEELGIPFIGVPGRFQVDRHGNTVGKRSLRTRMNADKYSASEQERKGDTFNCPVDHGVGP